MEHKKKHNCNASIGLAQLTLYSLEMDSSIGLSYSSHAGAWVRFQWVLDLGHTTGRENKSQITLFTCILINSNLFNAMTITLLKRLLIVLKWWLLNKFIYCVMSVIHPEPGTLSMASLRWILDLFLYSVNQLLLRNIITDHGVSWSVIIFWCTQKSFSTYIVMKKKWKKRLNK